MQIIDNINKTVKDDLQAGIHKGSKMSVAAACFSIYAYQELKKQLDGIDELRFIFTSPTFVTEKASKAQREFYIPRISRECSLYGTEFEVKLRNELTQKAIAKECADWIRRKVVFKSNVTQEQMMGFMTVDESTYMPINGFTTVDLGCERGNNAYYPVQKTESFENANYFLRLFEQLWNDKKKLQEVTDVVIENISVAYRENAPEYIYFVALYNITNLLGTKAFSFPKPTVLIKYLISTSTEEGDFILDFFSGSATTAHAVMQLNAEDGGHRKFIMVQLPEKCDEASEAYKAGYKNICEIGKERIRRAGDKIKSEIDVVHKDDYAALVESQQSNDQKVMTGFDSLKSSGVLTEKGYTYTDKDTKDISRITYSAENPNDFYRFHPNALDVGFRVLKLDDTNMKDVYYAPDDYDQGMLAGLESNIKDDRTDLDLLFGCLIDWGLPLSLPYKSEKIDGCTVHTYNDGDLIACFDANIPESVVKEIAQRRPLRAVFRDSGFASSPEKINVFEIFKLYMPEDANDISKRVRVI